MALRRRRVVVTAAGGGAGTSGASLDIRVNAAKLHAIRIEVLTLAGVATADLAITDEAGTDLTRTNNIVAGLFYPRAIASAADGTAAAAGDNRWVEHIVEGLVNIALSQANVGDSLGITFFTDEY